MYALSFLFIDGGRWQRKVPLTFGLAWLLDHHEAFTWSRMDAFDTLPTCLPISLSDIPPISLPSYDNSWLLALYLVVVIPT